jgi:hypothetical protein
MPSCAASSALECCDALVPCPKTAVARPPFPGNPRGPCRRSAPHRAHRPRNRQCDGGSAIRLGPHGFARQSCPAGSGAGCRQGRFAARVVAGHHHPVGMAAAQRRPSAGACPHRGRRRSQTRTTAGHRALAPAGAALAGLAPGHRGCGRSPRPPAAGRAAPAAPCGPARAAVCSQARTASNSGTPRLRSVANHAQQVGDVVAGQSRWVCSIRLLLSPSHHGETQAALTQGQCPRAANRAGPCSRDAPQIQHWRAPHSSECSCTPAGSSTLMTAACSPGQSNKARLASQ